MSDKEFPTRLEKKLPTGFIESVESMDLEEMKKKIYESEGHMYAIDQQMEQDEKLNGAKLLIKDLSAPYKDAKATEAAKIKYCFFVLEGRGVEIGGL
jgi:hypothetical protein